MAVYITDNSTDAVFIMVCHSLVWLGPELESGTDAVFTTVSLRFCFGWQGDIGIWLKRLAFNFLVSCGLHVWARWWDRCCLHRCWQSLGLAWAGRGSRNHDRLRANLLGQDPHHQWDVPTSGQGSISGQRYAWNPGLFPFWNFPTMTPINFWNFPTLSHSGIYWNLLKLTDSDTFRSRLLSILTLSGSNISLHFSIRHRQIMSLSGSNTFQFHHFPILTRSSSIFLYFGQFLTLPDFDTSQI